MIDNNCIGSDFDYFLREGNFSHAEVFGDVLSAEFTAEEAAEYLEVSVSTFRRYVQGKKIAPVHVVGRNQFFSAADLKSFKKSLRAVKRH